MAFVSKDRVKETSTTTGTGDFTLAGAQTGFKAFSAVCSSGDTFFYTIVNNVSGEFEIGEGTFTAGGALQRDTVLSSSNSNSAVTFGAGSKDVFLTAASDALIQASTDGTLTISEGTTFSADVSLGGDVLWDASANALEFNDNIKAVFGTDGDLFITHTGVVGRLVSQNGNIQIQAQEADSDVVIQADDQDGSYTNYFQANGGTGSAALFFAASGSSSVKLETSNTGVDITGNASFADNGKAIFGTGSDFEIYHDGSDTYFNQAGTGELRFGTSGSFDMQYFDGSGFRLTDNFELQFGSGNDFDMDYDSSLTAMVFNDNQTTKDFRFQQAGTDKIVFSFDNWEFQDDVKASFGTGSDLSIEHNATNSLIENTTGDLLINNSTGSGFVRVDCNLDSDNPGFICGIADNVDISTSTGVKSIIDTTDIELNRGNWTATSSKITCGSGQDGLYYIAIDIRFDSAVQRIAPIMLIKRSGSNVTQYSATGYIRNSSGHNDASLHQEVICSLTNGDYIEFAFGNDGLAGAASTVGDFGYGIRVVRLPMTYGAV
jgi:hypothetical protein